MVLSDTLLSWLLALTMSPSSANLHRDCEPECRHRRHSGMKCLKCSRLLISWLFFSPLCFRILTGRWLNHLDTHQLHGVRWCLEYCRFVGFCRRNTPSWQTVFPRSHCTFREMLLFFENDGNFRAGLSKM
jgi:hypothetical protein